MNDLPDSGISWTELAKVLNHERYALDYNRRWAVIKRHHARDIVRREAVTGDRLSQQSARSAEAAAVRLKDDYDRFRLPLLRSLRAR